MEHQSYIIRGRTVDRTEIETIRSFITTHWSKGRSAISRFLCEHWNWRQANGLLKERACRVMLLRLEEKGEITLPPRIREGCKFPKRADRHKYSYETSEVTGKVSEFGSLTIRMIRNTPDEGLWDHLVEKYHYLGKPWIVGSYLKHMAYLDGHLVACLGWGSAAWKVASRDSLIGWNKSTRETNLHKIVNNVRFLLLPWVSVEHLASKVLAANIKVLLSDWQDYYNHPISLLETFVEKQRFAGTCYKAANWQHIGDTKGRGKYDRHHNHSATPIKAVYIYPLSRNFRTELNG